MTLEQLEERLATLEETVEELRRSQQPLEKPIAKPSEDEIIPGTDTPIVLSKPPAETIRCEAVIQWVRESPVQELGLSDAEWASLGLEEGDE